MDTSNLSSADKEKLMTAMRQQVAAASLELLLQNSSDKCFDKCVSKPGTSLDSSQQKCVGLCMDRYVDAYNIVAQAYAGRLKKEAGNM